MSGLTRYIARQIALAVLFITVALSLIVWLSQSIRFVDTIVGYGLPLWTSLYFLALLLPAMLVLILPAATFIGVAFVYYKLIVDSELVVLRASGVSQLSLAGPALMLAAATAALAYAMTLYFVPASMRSFEDIEHRLGEDRTNIRLPTGVFTDLPGGATFFARDRDEAGMLLGIVVYDGRDPAAPAIYTAARGMIGMTPEGPQIVMEDGTYQGTDADSGRPRTLAFERATVALTQPADGAGGRRIKPAERYLHELFRPGEGVDEATARKLRAEGHQRLALPLYIPANAALGLAFLLAGDLQRRDRRLRLLVAGLLVVALQAAAFLLQGLTGRLPALAPLMYLVPLGTTALALWAMASPGALRRIGRLPVRAAAR